MDTLTCHRARIEDALAQGDIPLACEELVAWLERPDALSTRLEDHASFERWLDEAMARCPDDGTAHALFGIWARGVSEVERCLTLQEAFDCEQGALVMRVLDEMVCGEGFLAFRLRHGDWLEAQIRRARALDPPTLTPNMTYTLLYGLLPRLRWERRQHLLTPHLAAGVARVVDT